MPQLLVIQLTYSTGPTPADMKYLKGNKGRFANFDVKQWKGKPPPHNSSNTVKQELDYLASIKPNMEFIESCDDILNYFQSYFEDKPANFPDILVGKLLKTSAPVISELKWHYNCPRPNQLAKYHGVKLGAKKLDSMKTPAFPSGHSTQAVVVGQVLGDMFPEYRKDLLLLAEDVSMSRLVAKAHYPTDSKFGEDLGYALYKHYKKEKANETL